jgi:hypothetical protein
MLHASDCFRVVTWRAHAPLRTESRRNALDRRDIPPGCLHPHDEAGGRDCALASIPATGERHFNEYIHLEILLSS